MSLDFRGPHQNMGASVSSAWGVGPGEKSLLGLGAALPGNPHPQRASPYLGPRHPRGPWGPMWAGRTCRQSQKLSSDPISPCFPTQVEECLNPPAPRLHSLLSGCIPKALMLPSFNPADPFTPTSQQPCPELVWPSPSKSHLEGLGGHGALGPLPAPCPQQPSPVECLNLGEHRGPAEMGPVESPSTGWVGGEEHIGARSKCSTSGIHSFWNILGPALGLLTRAPSQALLWAPPHMLPVPNWLTQVTSSRKTSVQPLEPYSLHQHP